MSGKILIPCLALIVSSQCLTGDPGGEILECPRVSDMANLSILVLIGEIDPLFCDILFSRVIFAFVSPPKTISSNLSFRILNSFTATGFKRRGFFFSGSVAGSIFSPYFLLSEGMWPVS